MSLKVLPAPGLRVVDPVTGRALAADQPFEIRKMTTYWFRRVQSGDVVEVLAEQSAAQEQSETQAGEPASQENTQPPAGGADL